jgi:peptidyl-prolyl cis-trans isomerase C
MADQERNEIKGRSPRGPGFPRPAGTRGGWLLPAVLPALLAVAQGGVLMPAAAQTAGPEAAGQSLTAEPRPGDSVLPLDLPPQSAPPASGAEVARLKDALQEMNVQNPVVARVNGHEIRWAEVVSSSNDLPERYRDQIETVFPALLDRLVDLRLLAEAARAEGLSEDPKVQKRIAAYEERVLSGALLERYLAENVTTAVLRARYDAMVAARRADQEIRARHILVESEEEAEAIIAELQAGAVFVSLATERSQGPSAARGGDLGYFHPSRMAPAFGEAALALEPGEFTAAPVETEFGWHVILLVDRRADNIPSFLDMQDSLKSAATKEAVDRLVSRLRQQAYLEMFPDDAQAAGAAPAEPAQTEGQR